MLGGARSATRTGRLRAPYPVYPPLRERATAGFVFLDPRAFRIFQRQLQLTRQRLDGRAAALPRALGLETQIADAPTPRSDDPADRAVVPAIRMILIKAP